MVQEYLKVEEGLHENPDYLWNKAKVTAQYMKQLQKTQLVMESSFAYSLKKNKTQKFYISFKLSPQTKSKCLYILVKILLVNISSNLILVPRKLPQAQYN